MESKQNVQDAAQLLNQMGIQDQQFQDIIDGKISFSLNNLNLMFKEIFVIFLFSDFIFQDKVYFCLGEDMEDDEEFMFANEGTNTLFLTVFRLK